MENERICNWSNHWFWNNQYYLSKCNIMGKFKKEGKKGLRNEKSKRIYKRTGLYDV